MIAAALGVGCTTLGHVDDPLPRVRGPLPIRSNHPLNQTFLAFRPRRPVVAAPGETEWALHLAYASIHEVDARAGGAVSMDGETGRLSTRWRRGVADGFELEVEVPFSWATGGFLDGFVSDWHEAFGLANQGREFASEGDFDMRLIANDVTIYEREEDDAGIGDVPIVLTRELQTEGPEQGGVAVRFGLELPTGSTSSGRGNGQLDFGAGLLGERTWGRWTTNWALDLVVTGRPSSFAGSGVDAEDMLDVQGGLEYRWSNSVSLVAELVVSSPIVDAIELEEIDSPILELGTGLAIDGPAESVWYVAFQEDVLAAAGSDFTLFVGWASSP